MLLKDLAPGKRFMFEDRVTPLALAGVHGNFSSKGTFKYLAVCEGATPKLLHEETGKEVVVVSGTYYRHILPII